VKQISIICGANTQVLEGVEKISVGELRERMTDVMNIPSPAQAIIGGRTVNDEEIIDLTGFDTQSVQIEFVKPAGTKG